MCRSSSIVDLHRPKPRIRDARLCHFCSWNVVQTEAQFVMECPICNPIKERLLSLFLKSSMRESQFVFFN